MSRKILFIILTVIAFIVNSCYLFHPPVNKGTKEVILDFRNCLLDEKQYNFIKIDALKGFRTKKTSDEGFCEYRIVYKDSMIFYISTDIYSGSHLNSNNRLKIGIDTYAKNRSLELIDTFMNKGVQENGEFWLEYILGDVVVGYVNVPPDLKGDFNKMVESFVRVD